MRKAVISLVSLVMVGISFAQGYQFAGLEYGSNPSTVEDVLNDRGYSFLAEFEGVRVYEGTMLDHPVFVGPMYDDYNRLETVTVNFYINGEDIVQRDAVLIDLYDQLTAVITERYGAPFLGEPLPHLDGKVDDTRLKEDGVLAHQTWVSLASAMSGTPDGLTLIVMRGDERDTQVFRGGATATPDDVMLSLGYMGDPSSGKFDTGTGVDDL